MHRGFKEEMRMQTIFEKLGVTYGKKVLAKQFWTRFLKSTKSPMKTIHRRLEMAFSSGITC